MAFAPPDPLRIAADERRVQERRDQEVAILEGERIKQAQIRLCYYDGTTEFLGKPVTGHCPKQVRNAGKMISYHNDGAARVKQAEEVGVNCWENVGRSRGGRRKGNLYRCLVK